MKSEQRSGEVFQEIADISDSDVTPASYLFGQNRYTM
jgi:hypothetical protein